MKWLELLFLFIMAFLPALLYVIWIRNTEKINPERWRPIIFCFIWGATIAIIAAIILEFILGFALAVSITDFTNFGFITVVIIAPFAEELIKPLALRTKIVKKELVELEDGLIYGAVAGLGFAATENLLYGYEAYISEGLFYFLILISIRSFGGCLLHASATAWTGYGYGKVVMKHTSIIRILPYFLTAIILHAMYNGFLSVSLYGPVVGLFLALGLTAITITIVRRKIAQLDNENIV